MLVAALLLAVPACATAAADPVTVGASNFCKVPRGSVTGNVCSLWENGAATCAFTFYDARPCTFIVVARGHPAGGTWPELKVRFDGSEIYKTKIASTAWATYTFASAVATGTHAVSLCFENDALVNGEDRNLFVSDLTVIAAERADEPVPLSAAEYSQILSDRRDAMARDADERIEKLRKGGLTVKVVDSRGDPVSNALVSVAQIRHEFLFGTALASDMFKPDATNAEAAAYRGRVKKYFNHAVTENAMKWPEMEPKKDEVHYELVDAMAGWCRTNGIALRGHCLFWSCSIPEWSKALSDVDLRFSIMRRARNVVGHYRGLINEFDVCNEMLHCTYLSDRLGDSIFRQMCAEAEGANSGAVLYVNDYGILEGNDLDRYVKQIRKLREEGAPVGGIGVQAHLEGPIDPGRMQKALDALAQFHLPIKITEFGCSADDETVQAQTVEDVYRTAFAHSSVNGILMWGFWEKCHWRPKAAMLRAGFSKKPSAEAYERLVFSNWWTRAEGRTAADGTFACRAFFGDLNVRVRTDTGPEAVKEITLKKSAGDASLEIRLADAPVPSPAVEPATAAPAKKNPVAMPKPESDEDPFGYETPMSR
jgi:GH35 family endo-1,4-beta-xylanase